MTLPSPAGGPPRQLRPTDVKRLNRDWRRRTEGRLALLLDSVAQPFNVGSIVRTSAAFGATEVWLCGNTPPLDHPSVGKVALGTDRFLEVTREPGAALAAKAASAAGTAWSRWSSPRGRSRWRRRRWRATFALRSATRTMAAPRHCWPSSTRWPTSRSRAGWAR